jgi:ankyrin repeat protein
MIAAGRGKADVLRLLIDRGAALDQTAKFGLSAVMLAVINGHVEIVRMLVQAGARLDLRGTGAPGFSGKSAADLAAERGEPAMAEALRGTTST